ncbi:unnamed protein product [Polarella glacialis]|nr:unnamed protein product [Polarella glacialis]
MVLAGHSFGATTVVRYIQLYNATTTLRGAMLLDLWEEPLDNVTGMDVPFALLLSEEYATGSRVPGLCKLLSVNAGQSIEAVFFNGTAHEWVSESELFAPRFVLESLEVTGSGDYPVYIDATNRVLSLAFQVLLDPELKESLRERVDAVDPQIVTPFACPLPGLEL